MNKQNVRKEEMVEIRLNNKCIESVNFGKPLITVKQRSDVYDMKIWITSEMFHDYCVVLYICSL